MRVLSLFSGIGLLDLGLEWAGFRTVGLCEIEPACCWWLEQNWPGVPLWRDVKGVTGAEVAEKCGQVDIVAGGFPCQPHSVAGKRKGRDDERHLWPEFARVVREVRPRWVLAENVPGLRTTAADEVLSDLDAAGYSCWPLVVGADDVGAPHHRKRVWIVARKRLAHGDGERERDAHEQGREQREGRSRASDAGGSGRPVGHAKGSSSVWARDSDELPFAWMGSSRADAALGEPTGPGLEGRGADPGDARDGGEPQRRQPADPSASRGWPARPGEQQHEWEAPRLAESGLGGAVDGRTGRLAGRVRRAQLRALGNGVVPQVVAEVGRAILAAEEHLRRASAPKAGYIMNRTKPSPAAS